LPAWGRRPVHVERKLCRSFPEPESEPVADQRKMTKAEESIEEDKKIRQLQRIVDFACCVLRQQEMSLEEAQGLIGGVKKMALRLFPDKEQTFELIYGSRFRRILMERFPIS
jgi:hypothetical protein